MPSVSPWNKIKVIVYTVIVCTKIRSRNVNYWLNNPVETSLIIWMQMAANKKNRIEEQLINWALYLLECHTNFSYPLKTLELEILS
jgi:hypothetical protein